MESIENQINNLIKPENLTKKLKTLNLKLPYILDEFKKYFVFFNKNPEYQEYQNMFENIKDNLNTINLELLSLLKSVQSSTEDINKLFFAFDILIKKEKKKNKELKKKLGIVEHKNNASFEMISDYQLIYDLFYLRNWGIVLSVLVVGFSILKVFKKPTINFS